MLLPLASIISLSHLGMMALLVLGFGFVIFWHELGHFLAAKWVGVRVEQFAVGFGQAVVSWRKGIGFRMGNTQKDYRARAEKYLTERRRATPDDVRTEYSDTEIASAAAEIGLGDTEYRLNWIPLGGYVKMLGQDDLKPDALAEDPRAYNKKSISARMLVISAGVIMNIILAAIGFMVLFLIGFKVAPAWAGNVVPGSPAQKAGLQVGDRIITFDGRKQEDFTKITLYTALTKADTAVLMEIDRPLTPDADCKEFKRLVLPVTPARANGDKGFLSIGFSAPVMLQGPKSEEGEPLDEAKLLKRVPPDALIIRPGDVITKVNDQPVQPKDFIKFNNALQASHGQIVELTVRGSDGKIRVEKLQPHFEETFGGQFNLAGMIPRTQIASIMEESPVLDKVHPLDIIEALTDADKLTNPSHEELMARLKQDGETEHTIKLDVLRGNEHVSLDPVKATVRVDENRKGLGVGLMLDEQHTVVADVVTGSPADQAGLKPGDLITQINGNDVKTWYDVQKYLADPKMAVDAKGIPTFKIAYVRPKVEKASEKVEFTDLKLDATQLAAIRDVRYYAPFTSLAEYIEPRKTSNPLQAAAWGVTETRDFILQFYLTLRRMVGGSVSPSNMMGPVGIFVAGRSFAYKGSDWLIWFLAMISANLAVVNFLPIPVVDGGQFMFLIFEKIKGKPLSPRTMAIAQYAGLAFLAAVVLFVTWHDIIRHY